MSMEPFLENPSNFPHLLAADSAIYLEKLYVNGWGIIAAGSQCKTRCHSDVLLSLIVFAASSTTSFSWSLAASKGCEVSDNALKSTCGCLADKGSTFHSTQSGNCTEHP